MSSSRERQQHPSEQQLLLLRERLEELNAGQLGDETSIEDLREVIDGDVEEVLVLHGRRAEAAAGFSWVIGGRDVGWDGRGG